MNEQLAAGNWQLAFVLNSDAELATASASEGPGQFFPRSCSNLEPDGTLQRTGNAKRASYLGHEKVK
jgi:hypothetical protein